MPTDSVVTGDQLMVRKLNSARVLGTLRTTGPLSRAQVAKRLLLNRSTVSSIVTDLLDSGLVRETKLEKPSSGRPGMLLELNPAGGALIGVDINIDLISIVLTDFVANVLWSRRVEFDPQEKQPAVLELAEGLIAEALTEAKGRGYNPLGIGVGVAALVNPAEGLLVYAPQLGWSDLPLVTLLQDRFGLPVFLENEANAAALGEFYFGKAKGTQNLLFVSMGVGLAAGIMVNGRLLRGSNSFAGQIGHTITEPGGRQCMCGRQGCWVTQVGLQAISRQLRRRLRSSNPDACLENLSDDNRSHLTVAALAESAERGDPDVLTVLEETGEHLGLGIANLINIFDPEVVVIGGPLAPVIPHLIKTVRDVVESNKLGHARRDVNVAASSHGGKACAIGAVAGVFGAVTHESTLLQNL